MLKMNIATEDKKSEFKPFMLGVALSSYLFFAVLDGITTLIGVKYGIAFETNTNILFFATQMPFQTVTLIKIGVNFLIACVLYFFRGFKLIRFTVYGLAFLYGSFIIIQTWMVFFT